MSGTGLCGVSWTVSDAYDETSDAHCKIIMLSFPEGISSSDVDVFVEGETVQTFHLVVEDLCTRKLLCSVPLPANATGLCKAKRCKKGAVLKVTVPLLDAAPAPPVENVAGPGTAVTTPASECNFPSFPDSPAPAQETGKQPTSPQIVKNDGPSPNDPLQGKQAAEPIEPLEAEVSGAEGDAASAASKKKKKKKKKTAASDAAAPEPAVAGEAETAPATCADVADETVAQAALKQPQVRALCPCAPVLLL
ncbi:hypothetical protein CYMTET_36355 [Cymbomonas tetramitiformis]|uniref:Uncharacterized protein n=1 Tax=Cymbomonas tetramitiformis TaxID=36881 RepID=A0AAE0CG43_9CHLO|nr:hypothetical protein CYMTET_36355 [Cymbomonas tetramitiformis]